MSKNRFAQPLYGKIIYIYETTLAKEDLATIFNPDTYWIDVTGIDCEVGYLVKFSETEGLKLVPPPPVDPPTFEEEKELALTKVNKYIEDLITGGFTSTAASGEEVYYDSDRDTQLTMQGIALNVNSPLFMEKYPDGCPVRGQGRQGDETTNYEGKKVYMLNAEQVMQWCADLSMHIGACKQRGWILQAQVESCTSKVELDNVINFMYSSGATLDIDSYTNNNKDA